MRHTNSASRRLFLKQATALSGLGLATPFALNLAALGSSAAQTANDYKALVCIFLQGGNDHFNTVLATDAPSWASYTAVRNQVPESLVLPKDQLQVLSPTNNQGRSFGLHPVMAGSKALFNDDKRLAILANVGTLIEPIDTKEQYETQSRRLPTKLFSHNDQANTWQALGPEGTAVGWGGRMADLVAADNGQSLFTAISATGNSVWLSGQQVQQYQVGPTGPVRFGTNLDQNGVSVVHGSPEVAAALERIARSNHTGSVFGADLAAIAGRSIDAEKTLSQNLPADNFEALGADNELLYTSPANGAQILNPLAQQLRMVARLIAARSPLGMKRQVFFVNMYGFDTHDNQLKNHADLLARLDHALRYFNTTIDRLEVTNAVTTFTASDFGRTFTSNGDGTDHGWGSHHFVMGGAVKGGDIYGAFPTLGTKNTDGNKFDNSPDQLQNGALLPRISVEQYGATLAKWFQPTITAQELRLIFPKLENFAGNTNLGFMA
ncbi:MAG: hypothetical protein RJB60_905 [Pseudomonadota bacterium]|jgi:uncharacterized protein (DUF1501 family)